jgi:hypothetical protein
VLEPCSSCISLPDSEPVDAPAIHAGCMDCKTGMDSALTLRRTLAGTHMHVCKTAIVITCWSWERREGGDIQAGYQHHTNCYVTGLVRQVYTAVRTLHQYIHSLYQHRINSACMRAPWSQSERSASVGGECKRVAQGTQLLSAQASAESRSEIVVCGGPDVCGVSSVVGEPDWCRGCLIHASGNRSAHAHSVADA